VIEALAGTGKTYTAGVLRHVYQQAGYDVVGVAPTGRAVRELAEEAGIPSRTLDSLLGSLERGYVLPVDSVVVLDEAGMAPTRQTAALLEAAQGAGCKVIAIGDPGQLHSVQAGGWMRAVGRKVGTLRLSEVLRQRDPLERRALAALHDGAPGRWLEWAREHERVEFGSGRELVDRAVSDWRAATAEHGLAGAVLIARDNDTRRALNERARELLRRDGGLGDERSYAGIQLAVGDRVIWRRNDRNVDVDNGTRGTVRVLDEQGIAIETDAGTGRQLPAAYVAEHVEHAYALTGHGMQGGTVERAFVVAAPHELTKGWSYTALSRARRQTQLFVITDRAQGERDELAPGERQEAATENELYTRIARYMRTRDDEDLAIEQLPTGVGSGREGAVDARRVGAVGLLQEAGSEHLEPRVIEPPTVGAYREARARVEALEAQLQAVNTPEVARLEATERRERELLAHQDELIERADKIPGPSRLRLAGDHHVTEREHLDRAIDGVQAELAGLRSLRDRLVREIGQPGEIRSERASLESALARAQTERDRLLQQLIARELEGDPQWLLGALGPRPGLRRERDLWDFAARDLARYRLEQGVEDQRHALGEQPHERGAAERYEQARATLEKVQRDLGVGREDDVTHSNTLSRQYIGLLGDDRAARLEVALAAQVDGVRDLPDDQLRALARQERDALSQLDRQSAQQTLRLEHELGHHKEAARKQAARAAELEQRASELGWRERHEREHLRRDAALQHDHAARHLADTERLELELTRLRASARHPDQWLDENADRLAAGAAASRELHAREKREFDRQVELALLEPPSHVLEVIGERPPSGVRLAQDWERLAERIERHRLGYGLAVDRDGPLGPEPARMAPETRHTYGSQREQIAAEIEEYRHSAQLPDHGQAQAIIRQRERDQGLGLGH
jgi:hypothetical protein